MKAVYKVVVSLLFFSVAFAARAEKANVFFIYGANVSEQNACPWPVELIKRLWQAVAIQD